MLERAGLKCSQSQWPSRNRLPRQMPCSRNGSGAMARTCASSRPRQPRVQGQGRGEGPADGLELELQAECDALRSDLDRETENWQEMFSVETVGHLSEPALLGESFCRSLAGPSTA